MTDNKDNAQNSMVQCSIKSNGFAHKSRIIGFGSGAANILRRSKQQLMEAADLFIFENSEISEPDTFAGVCMTERVPIKQMECIKEEIYAQWGDILSPILAGAEQVIVLTTPGSTGGKLLELLIGRIAQECDAMGTSLKAFATLPFAFERKPMRDAANNCIEALKAKVEDTMIANNNDMQKHSTTLAEGFAWIDKQFVEFVK